MGKGCRARDPLHLVGALHLLRDCKVLLSSELFLRNKHQSVFPSTPDYQLRWSPKSASSARSGADYLCFLLQAGVPGCLAVSSSPGRHREVSSRLLPGHGIFQDS